MIDAPSLSRMATATFPSNDIHMGRLGLKEIGLSWGAQNDDSNQEAVSSLNTAIYELGH